MQDKIKHAMYKLRNTPVSIGNSYLFYNMYLTTQVYFGCGIVKLLPQQERILMKLSKRVLVKKIGLGENFPREVLYSRKSALGVGLLKPTTVLAILSMKLYVGHMRMEDQMSKMIRIIQENEGLQYGYNAQIMEVEG